MDSGVASALAKAIETQEELTFQGGLVAAAFVINSLNEWEDRYLIHKAGLAGEIDWQRHIRENINWTLGNRFALEVYKSNRNVFEAEFVEHIDSLVDDVSENGTYSWWTDIQSNFRNQAPEKD